MAIERISHVNVSFQAQVICLLIFTCLNSVGLKVVANYCSNVEISKMGEKLASEASGPQNGQELVWVEIGNYLDMGIYIIMACY